MPSRTRLINRAALLAAVIFTLLITYWVARTVWEFRAYPFDADEANHANGALALLMDLRAGDPAGFLRTLYGQGYYPPTFTLPKVAVFALFGTTPLVTRLFSTACLLLAALPIFLLGRELHPRYGNVVGLIGVLLALTSQPLLTMAGLTMMETPGVLITYTFLLAYLYALRRPDARRLLLTSLLLILVFLTKYTYSLPALALVLAIALFRLTPWFAADDSADFVTGRGHILSTRSQPLSQRWPALVRRWLWLLAPFAVAIFLWFVGPGKIGLFVNYATTQPPWAAFTWEEIIFYPRSLAYHYAPSTLFALLFLPALVWAVLRWRQPAVRILLLYFLIGMVEMFFNFPRNPRFIVTFVPAAHLLIGAMLVDAATRLSASRRERAWAAALGLLVVAGLLTAVPIMRSRLTHYPSVMQARYETAPGLDQIADWITDNVPDGERLYFINAWDQLSYQTMAWKLGVEAPAGTRFPDVVMPYDTLEEATPQNIAELRRQIVESGAAYVIAFEGTPWGEPVWYLYADGLEDLLTSVNVEVVYVDLYDADRWLDTSLCCTAGWEAARAEAHYTLQVKTTVYRVRAEEPVETQ